MKKLFSLLAIGAIVLGMASCGDKNSPEQPTPVGAINGKFSVAPGNQVYFSQGNLQYHQDKAAAHNDHFAFAEHQYTIIGEEGNAGIDKVPCTIDLFGWGTGNSPRKTSTDVADYAEFHKWGNNRIRNGGNEANLWRTLTSDEWDHIFHGRANAKNYFSLGHIYLNSAHTDSVNGVFLLPDEWALPDGLTFNPILTQSEISFEENGNLGNRYRYEKNTYNLNGYNLEEWNAMEKAGAIFLPAAGFRHDKDYILHYDPKDQQGYYWTSTKGKAFGFDHMYINIFRNDFPFWGYSVRLVQDVK